MFNVLLNAFAFFASYLVMVWLQLTRGRLQPARLRSVVRLLWQARILYWLKWGA